MAVKTKYIVDRVTRSILPPDEIETQTVVLLPLRGQPGEIQFAVQDPAQADQFVLGQIYDVIFARAS